jgi:DNA-binding MarR family transcriptional regulator
MEAFINKYNSLIDFSLSCYDRVVITGNLPEISYAQGMTSYLYSKDIRIFDYSKFAEGLRLTIRKQIDCIVSESGVEVQYLNTSSIRKESLVSDILKKRGNHIGIVCILSTLETCNTYKPWHDKLANKTFLKPNISKCIHYYIYFIDELLGLGYIRIPTWCPFRLQIYFNGHNLLASKLKEHGIDYTMIDNAFDSIDDPSKAQELSDSFKVEELHRKLEELAWKYCPVYKELGLRYHWSVMQAEYSTDIVFGKQADLQPLYSEIIATAIHTVKPDHISTFLGQKLNPLYQGEIGNNYHVRIEGTRIKHTMGPVSIKMYDKFSKILRIETTCNDISFFKHFREVVHRDGTTSNQIAQLKKNIYSLAFLADNLKAANRRYLDFIAAFDNKNAGRKRLERVTESKTENKRTYKGFNFFHKDDLSILLAILRGEFNINGFRNKNIKKILGFSSAKVSRLIKRLRVHGLIKKATDSYKYYLTKLGKETIIMSQKIKELVLVPAFCY